MKNALYLSLIAVGCLLACSSCKPEPEEDPGQLTVRIIDKYEGDSFEMGEVYYNVLDQRIRVDNFKSYISEVYAIKDDNSEVLVKDIFLANFLSSNSFSIDLEPGNYKGLRFAIGVPEELNKDNDPSVYPNDHPLSVQGAEGMFWFWNTGYIFTMFEGKADLKGVDGYDLLDPFAFHCGDDPLFIEKNFSNSGFTISENSATTKSIVFNVDQFFYNESDTINIAVDYLTHTSGNYELAERFMNLVDDAITLE